MARLSAMEAGKKRLGEVANFGDKLGYAALDILKPLGKGLEAGFNWLWDLGEKIYGSLTKRFGPVWRRWRGSLEAWWERRGWPPALLRLLGNALLALPVDIGFYLLNSFGCAGVGFFVPLNLRWLSAWLAFAGSVRAGWFYFKEIRPDRQKPAQGGSAEKGTPMEGGC